jgi:hypothetical protein
LGNLHLGGNAVGLVLEIRRAAFGDAHHSGVIRELGAAPGEARTKAHIEAFHLAVVEGQYVVLGRLHPE